MKIVITGSTGMVGQLVMGACLQADQITEVVSFVRKASGIQHAKLTEVILDNFEDYTAHDSLFQGVKAAYFCLGAYTGQVPDDLFKKITLHFAVAFGKALETNSPAATLCLLSGQGADKTEKSRTAFARYKGMAENQLAELNLQFYSFRPAYIYPVEPRKEPNFMYALVRRAYPLIKALGPRYSIPSTDLAHAMFHVGLHGAEKQILENQDIQAQLSA